MNVQEFVAGCVQVGHVLEIGMLQALLLLGKSSLGSQWRDYEGTEGRQPASKTGLVAAS